jgi:ATPase subunit of ABC transporter with duplicated ATPase domains
MAKNEVIINFDEVSFNYGIKKPILDEVSFTVRRGSKITIMGQNGAGKSTLFGLITGVNKPEEGQIHLGQGLSIAIARQVIPREEMDMTVEQFFQNRFTKKVYDIEPRIKKVLDVVNFNAPLDRIIKSFSGGQQARLLLASET